MNVEWAIEPPTTDPNSGMSKQCIVLTNRGYYNTGYYSSRSGMWYLDGPTIRGERVIRWMSGVCIDGK